MWLLALSVLLCAIYVEADICIITAPKGAKENLTVAQAFRKYEIVGDYLNKPPKDLLVITLPSDLSNCKKSREPLTIMPGDIVSPLVSFQIPEVTYPKATPGLYTVMLLNIDEPSRDEPTDRAYINGLFVNSPARRLLNGDVVVPYTPATPLLGTGLHRYIFIAYKQRKRINANSPDMWKLARKLTGFSAVDFAEDNDLEGPVAGNFVMGQFATCGPYLD